ncbi:MAG TPA: DNA polymerase III subunit gamma/tau [Bacillota bacterium]|nr:DNA polymerase III subunit gamma/tau [Bacillota bacterium]
MDYQALYRRWRPRGFSDFVGQSHVVTTLSNALATGRIAHAYLFTGPRGTGKTSTAKIFAKALNCESPHGVDPCDQCSACQRINEGTFLDVLEIDGASNRGIDEIRDLREKIKFTPAEGKYKIYIIDEVHMLTMEAFNALLKTLEEPPQFVVFILATTEVHKLPLTILSRCQRFDFKRFTLGEITGRLKTILTAENIEADDEALQLIAKHAEGGMRDALSLLEQCIAHSDGCLVEADVRAILGLIDQEELEKLAEAIQKRETKAALKLLDDVCMDGKDLFQFGQSLVEYFRDQLLASLTSGETHRFSVSQYIEIIETLATATNEVKKSFQSALPLELALIKLTTVQGAGDVLARLERLEQMVQTGRFTVSVNSRPVEVSRPSPTPPAAAVSKPAPVAAAPVNIEQTGPSVNDGGTVGINDFDWEGFLEKIKGKKRTVAALIQEGKPVKFDGSNLIVEFPPNLKFHLENLALPQNKELLENILLNTYGRPIKIACVPQNTQEKVTPPSGAESDVPDPLKQAVSLFGGKVEPI